MNGQGNKLLVIISLFTVYITLIAANFSPQFGETLNFYELIEEENNTIIGTITATDPDGDNLTYGIVDTLQEFLTNPRENAKEYLNVDPLTGEVTIAKPVDRELTGQLRATWTVADQEVEIVSSPVTIHVEDINDNRPSFTDLHPDEEELPDRIEHVKENMTTGSSIVSFDVRDDDSGVNGNVDVQLVSLETDCEMKVFDITKTAENSNRFQLVLLENLDYSVKSEYLICLNASDRGIPMRSSLSVKTVIIPVQDVQNLAPVFLNLPDIIDMAENATVGDFVTQLTAVDGDRGVPFPRRVEYSMDDDNFDINGTNGVVTVSKEVDREVLTENPIRLTVFATEVDEVQPKDQIQSSTMIFIRVLDVDDNIPQFDVNETEVDLYENAPNGTALYLGVTVTDADEVNIALSKYPKYRSDGIAFVNNVFSTEGRIENYIELELLQDFNAFELTTNTGSGSLIVDVRVIDNTYLDYEVRQQVNFTVEVVDHPESKLDVIVNLMNENDNSPEFLNNSYQESFYENPENGSEIVKVTATDADVEDTLTYRMVPDLKYFHINGSTGVVTVADGRALDAETTSTYLFTVEASDDNGAIGQAQVTLICMDVNDNAPRFLRHLPELSFKEFSEEDIPEGPIIKFEARDDDSSEPNNEFEYTLLSGDEQNKFYIDPENGTLSFVDAVDYDGPDGITSFLLTIAAVDKGNTSLTGTTNLTVNIENVNDNAPEFDEQYYWFMVYENSTRGDIVGTVYATDDDIDDVSYILISGGIGVFGIDGNGTISVNGDLDREREAFYSLTILATDGVFQDNCTVDVIILDVNDESPKFTESEYEFSVYEGEFGEIDVMAEDDDEDSLLYYSLEITEAKDENGNVVDGTSDGLFDINENNGTIYIAEPLDREQVETFKLKVTVTDENGISDQTAEADVHITVLDVNDERPNITAPDRIQIAENSFPGTVVTTEIKAEDKDKGENAVVSYSLVDNANGSFSIDPDDGTLFVKGKIDREMNNTLTITVQASNNGSMISTKILTIWVLDVNDNPPVFEEEEYFAKLLENSEPGTFVINVTATDADSDHEDITYSIQRDTENWFTIDPTTGTVVVQGDVDREKMAFVSLTVVAEEETFQGFARLNITVLDENDNSPHFISFPEKTVTTTESTGAGVVIVSVVATDPDEGDAGQVAYNIIGGSGTDLFDINETTGEVYTKVQLSGNVGTYSLEIEASDGGEEEPSQGYENRTMEIYVDSILNTPPKITFPEQDDNSGLNIPEGFNDPTKAIFTAEATDPDAGDDGEIAFRFVEVLDWELFRVDNISGEVFYTSGPVDWFDHPQFQLLLEAYNYLSEPQFSDRVDFVVEVIDSDNHDPVFRDPPVTPPAGTNVTEGTSPIYDIEDMWVVENKPEDTYIGQVTATDRDENEDIYYFIIEGNENGFFMLNKTTGELYTTDALDSDLETNVYELTIKATEDPDYDVNVTRSKRTAEAAKIDYNDPSLQRVRITIVDENDSPPRFDQNFYTAALVYTTDFDVPVIQIQACDDDVDEENKQRIHTIKQQTILNLTKDSINNDAIAFYIDETSGVIYTAASFLGLTDGIYVELNISVDDPTTNNTLFTDDTTALIYVIVENQQLNVHTLEDAETAFNQSDLLKRKFEEILMEGGGEVDVKFDRISSYTFEDGTVNVNETESLFHVVNITIHEDPLVVPAETVLYILDHAYEHVEDVRQNFSVKSIHLAVFTASQPLLTPFQIAVTIIAGILLFILTLAILAFFFLQNQNAKELGAYGINPSDYKRQKNDESEPFYDETQFQETKTAYENPAYQQDETTSKASSAENVMDLEEEDYEEPTEQAKNLKLLEDLLQNQGIAEISDV